MGSDPCLLFFVNESFNVCILTIGHYPDENMGRDYLTCIWVNDLCRVTGPIHLNLLSRLSVDMHSSTTFLFILLNVVAKLRIHEWFITSQPTFFHVFSP